MVQGKINRGRHTDHPAGHHSIQTNQCSPPPSPIFFTGRMPFLRRPTNSVKALKATSLYRALAFNSTDALCQLKSWQLLHNGIKKSRAITARPSLAFKVTETTATHYFLLVVQSNNASILHRFIFTVCVTACDVENSVCFDMIIELTYHVYLPTDMYTCHS